MAKLFKHYFNAVKDAFEKAPNAHILRHCKTAVIRGKDFGYAGNVLIYSATNEVKLGYSPACGWLATEIVEDPRTGASFVLCTED